MPKKRQALGEIQLNKSNIVAALALPMLKSMMVILLAVALGIGRSAPLIGTLNHSANILT
ncbi:MAG TPA: hypothetical protein PKD56_04670 [Chitinophagales bacterium]|nr:hypothetical protein [Chitinophagales bacterium]